MLAITLILFHTIKCETRVHMPRHKKVEKKLKLKEVTNRGSLFTHFATTVKSESLFIRNELSREVEMEKNRAINHY